MRIASRINIRQGYPRYNYARYNGMLPVGDSLGEELGGVGYIGIDGVNLPIDEATGKPMEHKYSPTRPPEVTTKKTLPLRDVDENGNPLYSTTRVETEKNKTEERRVKDIMGIPSKTFAFGVVALFFIGGYFLYKGVIKKS